MWENFVPYACNTSGKSGVSADTGIPAVRSRMTSPARIRPATEGTKALLPGMSRRSVHLCLVPGGQMQWLRQLMDISSSGQMGGPYSYPTSEKVTISGFTGDFEITITDAATYMDATYTIYTDEQDIADAIAFAEEMAKQQAVNPMP